MHAPNPSPLKSQLADLCADLLVRLRAQSPRIHCITNAVAQNFSANVLLAAGAVPSMTVAPEEVGAFVARADALLVNLGTFDRERRAAAEIAIAAATQQGRPWMLDPVFVDRSPLRATFAKTLVAKRPASIHLNGAEFSALAETPVGEEALRHYALEQRCVVALTGATDVVSDGARVIRIDNGDPLMGRVTAMGCASAALVTAALAIERDALLATAAGLLAFGVAGEIAASRARGPGSLAVEIIDALHGLDRDTLRARARVG
jgi:hydroxyethylthiazole kinase